MNTAAAAALLGEVLVSETPRDSAREHLKMFEPIIGRWNLIVTNYSDDGKETVRDGEWTFAWALDGRAVVDVWMSPARATRVRDDPGECGISIRFWDPSINAVRSTWIGPGRGWVIPFIGRQTEHEFIIESVSHNPLRRWIFSDVKPTGFAWRAEETADPSQEPFARQRFLATPAPTNGPDENAVPADYRAGPPAGCFRD
jgi:hypothetical protein